MKNYFLATLILLGLSACGGKEQAGLENSKKKSTGAEVVLIEPTDVLRIISIPGTIIANEEVQLFSEVTGRIKKIVFSEGKLIAKNALLVQIDSDILSAEKKQLLVNLDLAKKDEARKRILLVAKGISQEDFERSASALSSIQAQIELIDVQISKASIRAPFSGRIGLRQVSEGAFINTTTLITTLVQENPIKVEFSISERYASAIKIGQTINFKLDQNNKTYEAKVYASESMINAGTRMMTVRASLKNDGNLIPGAFVSIQYNLGTEKQAFMVPTESVVPVLKGQNIFVVRNGIAVEIPVEMGIRTDDKVQVIGDLKAGDKVLISGILSVKNGMPITTKLVNK